MSSPSTGHSASHSDPRPFTIAPRQYNTGANNWRSKSSSRPTIEISPVEVGCFSVNELGEFVNDASKSRFYRPPQSLRRGDNAAEVCWDLNRGYETWIRRDDSLDDFLDGLLWWLQVHGHTPTHDTRAAGVDGRPVDGTAAAASGQTASDASQQQAPFADLICCRSLIAKLLRTPYQTHQGGFGWKIIICRYNGVLYGNDKEEDNRKPQCAKSSNDPQPDIGFYRGFKFETYITAPDKDAEPDPDAPVNTKQSLLSVVKTKLGSHQLVYIADVDCFDVSTNHPIELKTTELLMLSEKQQQFKRYRMMDWWAQCVLNGTSKIVCGFRDTEFIVRQLREYTTSQLPQQAASLRGAWNANESFSLCQEFMEYIKRTMNEDFDKAIYVFNFNPSIDSHHVICRVYAADSEGYAQHAFLPSWFTGDTVHCRRTQAAAAAAGTS